ncbi:MAG: DUF445 domain-containing protein [Dermatophilaceae bacterium]
MARLTGTAGPSSSGMGEDRRVSLMAPSPADVERRASLRRMRVLATSLLGLAAAVYLTTLRLDHDGVWGYVNTAAEAAMVGAIADWFAVTALFKRPLGLPIPHTSIIPTRKDEIGRNLEDFVTDNFFTEEIARERLRQADAVRRFGVWLGDPAHRRRVMTETAVITRVALANLDDAEVRTLVEHVLVPRLVAEPFAPVAGALLDGVVRDRTHHGLVDLVIRQLHDFLRENPGAYHEVLGTRVPWWTPPWLDERVIGWTYDQVLAFLADLVAQPEHPARRALDDLLERLAHDLQHDSDTMARAENLKALLLNHPQVPETAVRLWRSVSEAFTAALADENSYIHRRGEQLLERLGDHLVNDDEWRTTAEAWLADAVAFVVGRYGRELAEVISVTIDRWDGREAGRRIELFVGRDLQFIRINGTVVGALAGVVIHAVARVAE